MDSNLLFNEKQYRRINDEFKTKTSKLLKDIEHGMDENFKDLMNDDDACVSENSIRSTRFTPTSGRSGHIGSEGVIRVLQAKVKVLSEQLSTLQLDYIKRTDEWKCLQGEMVKYEENSLKNKQCLVSTHDRLQKQEKLVATITGHLQIRDRENSILKKQIESLKRELTQQESNSNANDVRLNRSLEEIERLKESLKKSQHEEKHLKDTNKTKQDDFKKIVSRLEKQKSEIILSFKKQMLLISNLKKQQGILETSSLLNLTEEEFIKLLDWNPGFT